MRTLNVALGERSYPIHIGSDLLGQTDLFAAHVPQKRVLIVTNTTVAPRYRSVLKNTLKTLIIKTAEVILPYGEKFKD